MQIIIKSNLYCVPELIIMLIILTNFSILILIVNLHQFISISFGQL